MAYKLGCVSISMELGKQIVATATGTSEYGLRYGLELPLIQRVVDLGIVGTRKSTTLPASEATLTISLLR